MKKIFIIILIPFSIFSQNTYEIAILKYNGGGDWYANPTSLPNLIEFCNNNIKTTINNKAATVEVGSKDIINYPFIHMTGHGNVIFSDAEAENLRNYLLGGGFLHIDDNYGMDQFIRRELKKVFPKKNLEEISNDHPIYLKGKFIFNNGMPKIHTHDSKPAKAYGISVNGRLVCIYTHETDLSDGWEDQDVHNNTNETRIKALKMGCNIIEYAFSN